jgi:hypothetical protein
MVKAMSEKRQSAFAAKPLLVRWLCCTGRSACLNAKENVKQDEAGKTSNPKLQTPVKPQVPGTKNRFRPEKD